MKGKNDTGNNLPSLENNREGGKNVRDCRRNKRKSTPFPKTYDYHIPENYRGIQMIQDSNQDSRTAIKKFHPHLFRKRFRFLFFFGFYAPLFHNRKTNHSSFTSPINIVFQG